MADGRWFQEKEQGCKREGNDNCLGGHDITHVRSVSKEAEELGDWHKRICFFIDPNGTSLRI